MAKKSIDDVMNEIEDFLNSCKTTALSSNKLIVPRDQFDDLFADLRVKIPAEIDRCKKIMRNKEAILMEARREADKIITEANQKANSMVSETEIMMMANQQAYETVEMAKAQANDILNQAIAEGNEIRLGSMEYTNDIMEGVRGYIEATLQAERANYENLIQALSTDLMVVDANINEVQNQVYEFTGDPSRVTSAPKLQNVAPVKEEPKKNVAPARPRPAVKEPAKSAVNIPDFVASGEAVVPNETPLPANAGVKKEVPATQPATPVAKPAVAEQKVAPNQNAAMNHTVAAPANNATPATEGQPKKVVKKKIVKKRNPVIHTPQTAQETVAKTVEAANANKVDKTVYKANGEQAREVPPMEGRVKRGPRMGRGAVEEVASNSPASDFIEIDTGSIDVADSATKSMGVVDDFAMKDKF